MNFTGEDRKPGYSPYNYIFLGFCNFRRNPERRREFAGYIFYTMDIPVFDAHGKSRTPNRGFDISDNARYQKHIETSV